MKSRFAITAIVLVVLTTLFATGVYAYNIYDAYDGKAGNGLQYGLDCATERMENATSYRERMDAFRDYSAYVALMQ